MNCIRCNTPNEEEAKFCKSCGMDMTFTPSNDNKNSKSSDILLIIYLCMAIVLLAARLVIDELFYDYEITNSIIYSLYILQNSSMILIPLSIKNKSLKIAGLIITTIYASYWVCQNVMHLMN